jgi:anti-sigma factor RsiW
MSEHNSCGRSLEIVAYLDGELDSSSLAQLELHLEGCSVCSEELRIERSLQHELTFALADDSLPEIPENFAQFVAARAQSDMSGVRDRGERKLALGLCAALMAFSFLLLGGAGVRETVLAPIRAAWKVGAALFSFLGHALYDAGAGVAVISRGLGGYLFAQSPRGLGPLVLLLLALILFTLARLIVRYHRTRIIE